VHQCQPGRPTRSRPIDATPRRLCARQPWAAGAPRAGTVGGRGLWRGGGRGRPRERVRLHGLPRKQNELTAVRITVSDDDASTATLPIHPTIVRSSTTSLTSTTTTTNPAKQLGCTVNTGQDGQHRCERTVTLFKDAMSEARSVTWIRVCVARLLRHKPGVTPVRAFRDIRQDMGL